MHLLPHLKVGEMVLGIRKSSVDTVVVLVSSSCELAVTDSIVEHSRAKISLKVVSQTSSDSDTFSWYCSGWGSGKSQLSSSCCFCPAENLSHPLKLILLVGQLSDPA